MRKVMSLQRDVRFFYCKSPVEIDKRGSWGNSEDNIQRAPNGAYLKTSSETEISHLVQPNEDGTAPVGWVPGSEPGLFDKEPIWIDEDNLLQAGESITLETLDGTIKYDATEESVVCYNDKDGAPNKKDVWVQKLADVKKNYEL